MRLTSLAVLLCLVNSSTAAEVRSAFYPADVVRHLGESARQDPMAKDIRDRVVEMAKPWMAMSDDQLWELMFPANLPRSWMVWSDGHCPQCKQSVVMYNWKVDAIRKPWKVQCPHCDTFFPTNDFEKFYRSGLDDQGLFDPKKANRELLFNDAHPDPKDPLHKFGVDDSTGYLEGDKRWRFIPAYLVFGQWKQAVLGGVKALATAHVLTNDPAYAHKAGVLLHRISTLYPSFTFKTQGVVYEIPQGDGYVSIWHDACAETREMAICYDAVKEAIARDEGLAKFLAAKPGARSGDVIGHIEEGILRDPIRHSERIYSNYPQQPLTLAVIHTALGWPGNRAEVLKMLKPVLDQATAVDGTTGEKGLAGYSAYAAQQLALFLGYYTRMDREFLADLVKQNPRLPGMWKFFVETRCLERYYPLSGDTGWFAGPMPDYVGVLFSKDHFLGSGGHSTAVLPPSMYSFLYDLYKLTGDVKFAQTIYRANGGTSEGLPYDLFAAGGEEVRKDVEELVAKNGAKPRLGSVNFGEWHLAILRAGEGEHARAAWLDYDAGGAHGHADGMNVGLFAHGLDLVPDFGYPPVQFGGWESARANWYKSTWAHNTVVVDSANQPPAAGRATMFAAGEGFAAVTADGPGLVPGSKTFARTVALVDTSAEHSYVLDVFRVVGGRDHIKGFTPHFSRVTTTLGGMEPAKDIQHGQMRDFRVARAATPGWSADFQIEDRYKLLASTAKGLHLKHIDLTREADAYTGEAWVVAGIFNSTEEAWVPRLVTRRTSTGTTPLASTFVSVLDPYNGEAVVTQAERLDVVKGDGTAAGDEHVCVEVGLADGRRDYVVSSPGGGTMVRQEGKGIETDAALAVLRVGKDGRPAWLAICRGTRFVGGDVEVELEKATDFVQLSFDREGRARVLKGDGRAVKAVSIKGVRLGLETPSSLPSSVAPQP
jgi:hypothetical protein